MPIRTLRSLYRRGAHRSTCTARIGDGDADCRVVLVGAMKSLGSKAKGARLERMKASPRWAGEGFRNVHPILPGLRDRSAPMPTWTDFFCSDDRRTPTGPLPSMNPLEEWRRRPGSGLRATWLGHSTVLIEIDGVRVLTDPVWGPRASPLRLAGPKRFQPVPVALRAMPPVDLVIVSHDHYDHLDYPTIRALARSDVPFVTSLGVGAHLEAWGIAPERITELDWWESYELPTAGLRVTAAPSQHFSGRTMKTRNATLWSSFALRSGRHGVFFSGDTGLTTEYEQIGTRLGPFDLVMLEIGAWNAAWGDMHLGPENALKAFALLGGGVFLPVHWGTFALGMHAWDQPAEVLLELGPRTGAQLVMPRLGEPVEPQAASGRVEPWWRGADGAGESPEPGSAADRLPAGMPWPID
jgi:L-ascorbate metabolism protein UlaG (beta-lactamase superfamily)